MDYREYKNKDQVMKIAEDLKALGLSVWAVSTNRNGMVTGVETKIWIKGRRSHLKKLKEMGFEKIWGEVVCGHKAEVWCKYLKES